MVNFTINGNLFVVKSDISIIESCKFTGIQIPRFCYQEGLSIAGNCRMCLVELENSDKLVIACLTNIESNLNIITNSLAVKKARENVLETLLLNHPLDCPICDQGGECDLQDQTKIFGNYFNKMFSTRRGVEDKKFGSLIKTIMTRCIHCTRCVRYSAEVLGLENLGTLNRGNLTEIGNYSSKYIESSISGNLIDLCPVGALTAASHAFQTRPWELRSTETIDLSDGLGSSLFVNFKESEIVRVLPKPSLINKNIISNKARFSYDSLVNNRVYEKNTTSLLNWNNLLEKYYSLGKSSLNLLILINEQLDLKTINRLKFLMFLDQKIRIKSFSRYNQYKNFDLFIKDSINKFDRNQNTCSIILGSTIETENEIINTKIRLKTLNQDYVTYSTNLFYSSKVYNSFINLNINDLLYIFEGKFKSISQYLIHQKAPQIIISENLKKRFYDINYIKSFIKNINSKIQIIEINASSNTESNIFLGIKSVNYRDFILANYCFIININENIILRKILSFFKGQLFYIYSHYSEFLNKEINIIPKNSQYFEESGIYLNQEQKFQKSQKVLIPINHSDNFQLFIEEIINDKNIKFNYLDFIKEMILQSNDISMPNKFSISLSKRFLNLKKKSTVSYYPVKIYLQDKTKIDIFIKNSYSLTLSSLNSRYNFF